MWQDGYLQIQFISLPSLSLQRRLHIQIRPFVVVLPSVILHSSCETSTEIRLVSRRSRSPLRQRALQFPLARGSARPVHRSIRAFLAAARSPLHLRPLVRGERRAVSVHASLVLFGGEPYRVHRVRGRGEGVRIGMLAIGRAGKEGRGARGVRVTLSAAILESAPGRSSIAREGPSKLAEDCLIRRLLGRGRVHFLPRSNQVLPSERIARADLLYRAREYQSSESNRIVRKDAARDSCSIRSIREFETKKEENRWKNFEKTYLLLPRSFDSSSVDASFSNNCFLLLPFPSRLSLDLENERSKIFSPTLVLGKTGRVRAQPS